MPGAIEQLKSKFETEGVLTPRELRFLDAVNVKQQWDNKEINSITPDQEGLLKEFQPLIERLGTPYEEDVLSDLELSSPTNMRQGPRVNRPGGLQVPDLESEVSSVGFKEGLGNPGALLNAVEQSLPELAPSFNGMPDFDAFKFKTEKRYIDERNRQRSDAVETDIDAFIKGQELGTTTKALGIGMVAEALTNIGAGKVLGKLGKFGAKKAAEVIPGGAFTSKFVRAFGPGAAGGAAGALTSEALLGNTENQAGIAFSGAVLDMASRGLISTADKFLDIPKGTLLQAAESSHKKAMELAINAVIPYRKSLHMVLQRFPGKKAEMGKYILDNDILPPFSWSGIKRLIPFRDSQVPARLDAAKKTTGAALGNLRKELDDYADGLFDDVLSRSLNEMPDDQKAKFMTGVELLKGDLKVDFYNKVIPRFEKILADVPPGIGDTPSAIIVRGLRKKIDEWKTDPRLTVNNGYASLELAQDIRQHHYVEFDARHSSTAKEKPWIKKQDIISATLGDEIDQTVANIKRMKDTIGTNPSSNKIATLFTDNLIELRDLEKQLVKSSGGIYNAPVRLQNRFLQRYEKHQDLQKSYAIFNDVGTLLFQRYSADASKSTIGMSEMMAMGSALNAAAGSAGAKIIQSAGAGVLTKYLKGEKGQTIISRGTNSLSDAVGNLGAVVGGVQIPLRAFGAKGGAAGLTTAMYQALTKEDSPLGYHGFMIIEDGHYLGQLIDNIERDEKMSSTQKATILNRISHDGFVSIFYKGDKEKKIPRGLDQLQALREDLEGVPNFDARLDVERNPS